METFAEYRQKGDRLVDASLRESAAAVQQPSQGGVAAPAAKNMPAFSERRAGESSRSQAATDGLADGSMNVSWSQWSRCESSFSMLLVPHRPGVLALAEEVLAPQSGKRMLALFYVGEARDLSLAISELFANHSDQRETLE